MSYARRHGRLLATLMAMTLAACFDPPPGQSGERGVGSHVEDWRDEIIYQLVVDRFADGDYSNNRSVDLSHMGRYHGGDWQGVIDRIPYLEQLGVTAVWISPALRNIEQDAGFAGYHGYWTQDFLGVNPHFGDLAKLQELVDALHARGIKVILDIVTNHIGQLFYYDVNMNGRPDEFLIGGGGPTYGSENPDHPGGLTRTSEWDPDYDSRGVQAFTSLGEAGPAPVEWAYDPAINRVPVQPAVFQNPAWYHRRGRITVWENKPLLGVAPCASAPDDNVELCDYVRAQETLGDFPGGLKDLATEKPEVRAALINVFKHWISVTDVDGFRIDTLKHVEHGFWREFCPAMRQHAASLGKRNFLMFGEAFSGADQLLGSYTGAGQVDSVFYFSQKYRVFEDVFKKGAPTKRIEELHADRQIHYNGAPQAGGVGVAPRDLLINFIDNHDVPRFLHDGSLDALHAALIYLLTTIGVPCVYYGTEQQLAGGSDPANRETLWLGNPQRGLPAFDTDNATFKLMKTLIALRKQHAPLRRGDLTIRWATEAKGDDPDAGIFGFERSLGGETVLVVINAAACTEAKKSSRTSASGQLMQSAFSAGTQLVNVLPDDDGNDAFTVGTGGLDVVVPCHGGKILVRK